VGFKGVYKKFNGCMKKVSKLFQGSFKGFPIKIEGCSKIPPMVIQGSFKKVYLKEVQRCFK